MHHLYENLIPFGSIMFILSEPSIKFAIPGMVLTLTFVNIKYRKYLLSRIIMCVVTQLARHISPSFILRLITPGFHIKLIKTIDNINNNVIDVKNKMILYLILI